MNGMLSSDSHIFSSMNISICCQITILFGQDVNLIFLCTLLSTGSISRNTKLMLASAMYFKGKWKNAFDLDKTTQNCFYVEVDQCFNANFMDTVKTYNYAYIGNLHAQAVELPYEVRIV
jgi:serine protease inhibitor